LALFDHSVHKALVGVYPDRFNIWSFSSLPKGYITSGTELRKFFDSVAPKLNVTKMEDWYRVTAYQLKKIRAYKMLPRYEYSLPKALMAAYPEYKWLSWKFVKVPTYVCSGILFTFLKTILG
jgi:hypothetical protein